MACLCLHSSSDTQHSWFPNEDWISLRHHWSSPAAPVAGVRALGGASECAEWVNQRSGVQHIDNHDRRRNHVGSGDDEGAGHSSGVRGDPVGGTCNRCDRGVYAEVHEFRKIHYLRGHDGWIVWVRWIPRR